VTGIINKPLLLHLVGCLYYLYQWCTVKQISENTYMLIKYIKSVLWRGAKRLSYIEDARCLKVKRRIVSVPSSGLHQAIMTQEIKILKRKIFLFTSRYFTSTCQECKVKTVQKIQQPERLVKHNYFGIKQFYSMGLLGPAW